MLIQKVLNIYDENFQEESMQWILFNFQVFQGWPRRFLRWAPEMPLRWEDINAEVSGYLIISEQTEKQVVGHLKFIENVLWRLFSVN